MAIPAPIAEDMVAKKEQNDAMQVPTPEQIDMNPTQNWINVRIIVAKNAPQAPRVNCFDNVLYSWILEGKLLINELSPTTSSSVSKLK